MGLALGQILAGVPMGWNEAENALAKRRLEQQQYDTIQRQAPLQDDLLKAQAIHLRMAGTQAAQRRAEENAATMALYRAMTAPGGTAPSLATSPVGNAPPMPQPQQVQTNPVAGSPGQLPFVEASLPQGSQPQPFQGLAPGGLQPGPMGGAPQPPQPPSDPYIQNLQATRAKLEQGLAFLAAHPSLANATAYNQLSAKLSETYAQEAQQRKVLDDELRKQQLASSLITRREESSDLAERKFGDTQKFHQGSLDIRREGQRSHREEVMYRALVSSAENEAKNLATAGLLRREDLSAIAQKWGVSSSDIQTGLGAKDQSQLTKDPFESTSLDKQNLFKAAVKTQIAAKGLSKEGFVMDFEGRRFRIYQGGDGETHYDLEK